MLYYIGIVHKAPRSDWGISFPDLPGCTSAAATLEAVGAAAEEAVALWMEEAGKAPAASTLDKVRKHADAQGAATFLPVRAPDPERVVRLNVTLPESLVQRIDAKVGQGRRSGFLASAAREALEHAT